MKGHCELERDRGKVERDDHHEDPAEGQSRTDAHSHPNRPTLGPPNGPAHIASLDAAGRGGEEGLGPARVPYRSCSSWQPQSALHLHGTPACYPGAAGGPGSCGCTNVLWGGGPRGRRAEGSAVVRGTTWTLRVVVEGGCVRAPPHLGPGRREGPSPLGAATSPGSDLQVKQGER